MERHKKKKKKRNIKKLKILIVIILILGLVLQLSVLNNQLRKTTDTNDHNLYEISKKEDMYYIHLLGKKYYLNKDSINNAYKSILKYKEKIFNK